VNDETNVDAFGPDGDRPWKCGSCANKDKMNCQLQMAPGFVTNFGSLINFGCLAGALLGGSFVDRFGKKKGMFMGNLFGVVGWLLIVMVPNPASKSGSMLESAKHSNHTEIGWDGVHSDAANESGIHTMLMVARMAIGIGVGIICCSVNAYQVELSTLKLRGAVGTMFQFGIVIGIFITYLIGSVISWKMLAIISLGISGAGCILLIFLPESPIWLVSKGRDREARAALVKVRNPAVGDIDDMLAKMKDTVSNSGDGNEKAGFSFLISDKASRKALFIGVGLMVVQQFGGINAVMFYCGTILQAVTNGDVDKANKLAVGSQALQLVTTGLSAFMMDRAGRKPILLWAAAGQAICSTLLGLYFVGIVSQESIALVGLYGYIFFFASGMGAIPWSIMAEIFDPKVKGLASSLATAMNWLLSWVITFTVNDLKGAWQKVFDKHNPNADLNAGMGGVFFTYGSISLLGCFFIWFVIPETKGKEIGQILAELRGEARSGYTQIN
jgi:SP family facilitated glucose transporter-like MFS transporter 8